MVSVRQARADDHAAVVAMTEGIWADREVTEYIPDVFEAWVESDGPTQRTLVATVDGAVAGLCQGVLLSDHEAWAQGMRVDPDHRGAGIGPALTEAVFEWASGQGATVCRNLVFSWNDAGLGLSRAAGFEPLCQFRFCHPEPDAEADSGSDLRVTDDAAAAWSLWQRSEAKPALRGLVLDPEETWALSEVTRETVLELADSERVFAVQGTGEGGRAGGTRGAGVRVRDYESPDGTHYAEYGFGAWADLPAARALLGAIKRDAAALDADETRVVIPETAQHVSDAAYARGNIGDAPEFVLEKDLT